MYIREDQEISRGLRGCTTLYILTLTLTLIIKPFLGTYQEIHLYRVMYIESVRINTSQIMTREGCTGNVGQSNLVHVDSKMLRSTIQCNAL